MKKTAPFLLILFILPLISAIEFDMQEEFMQGETLMAKVSGNFLQPLQKTNIFFYREHVRVPFEYDMKKINDDYYIYAVLVGKEPKNYSIALENILYMKGGEVSEENVAKNFTINNQTADFSINPGFASGNEFSIEVQNLQENKITISVKISEGAFFEETYPESITLKSGEKKDIDFVLKSQDLVFKTIELSTGTLNYEIPVLVPATEITEEEIFKFEPNELFVSAPTNEETIRIIYLYNTGDEAIENITLSLSNSLESYANLSITNIEKLDTNSNVPITLVFFSNEEFELDGHVKAKQGEKIIYSTIGVKFLEGYVPVEEPLQNYTTKTCAEMGYAICSKNEECSSKNGVYAKDEVCCIGICKTKAEKIPIGKIIGTPIGKIIGIIILIVIVGVGFWFYKKKYKGAKKPVNFLDVAKNRPEPPRFAEAKKKLAQNPERRIVERPIPKIVEAPVVREVVKKVFVEKPKAPVPKYISSSNTKKYHKSSCRLARLIKEQHKESSDDLMHFQGKGYKPCKVCFKS